MMKQLCADIARRPVEIRSGRSPNRKRPRKKRFMVIPFEQLDENQAWQTPVDQTGHHQNYGG